MVRGGGFKYSCFCLLFLMFGAVNMISCGSSGSSDNSGGGGGQVSDGEESVETPHLLVLVSTVGSLELLPEEELGQPLSLRTSSGCSNEGSREVDLSEQVLTLDNCQTGSGYIFDGTITWSLNVVAQYNYDVTVTVDDDVSVVLTGTLLILGDEPSIAFDIEGTVGDQSYRMTGEVSEVDPNLTGEISFEGADDQTITCTFENFDLSGSEDLSEVSDQHCSQ